MTTNTPAIDPGTKLHTTVINAQAEYAKTKDPVDYQHALESAVVTWRNESRGRLPAIDPTEYDDDKPCITIRMMEDFIREFHQVKQRL